VLATFGFILFFNQLVLRVFGATSQEFRLPDAINFPMPLFGFTYPSYRLIVIVVGLAVALGLYLVIAKTRMGMLIRAGASNRPMVGALGVNIRLLFTVIFGIGAALAGLAGVMIGPIESVESGMGESKLILAFVVIVIGGIGSIRGAFIASIMVGLVEVTGRVFMKDILRNVPIGDLLILIITMFAFIAIMMGKSRALSAQVLAVVAIFALKVAALTEFKASMGAPAFTIGAAGISVADLLIVVIAAAVLVAAIVGKAKFEQSVVLGMAVIALIKIVSSVIPGTMLASPLREEFAQTAGPALASMSIYILMAFVLYFRPQGLFPARTG
jgi:branched-subunit amino acid ABC-type transport system permease component